MKEQIDKIETDVRDIKKALLGDEFNTSGLISRVDENAEYIKKDKKFKWTVAGFLTAIALFKDKIISLIS